MSNYLTGLSQLNPQVKRHNGGTTTLTLDENGTTNATLLFVNGVAQTPGIDFNVSGTTLTCTSTLPAGTNIATTIQYFNTGIVNTVADDAIGLAQMASGTDGNIISYDASGNPVAVATGNDGQVLTSTGAGSPPAFETPAGGGAWTLIGTSVASSSASLTITGIDSTYDTYAIFISDIVPATNDVFAYMRFGDSGGIDSGGSDYAFWLERNDGNTTTWTGERSTGASAIELGNGVGNATGEAFHARLYLLSPSDGSSCPTINGQVTMVNHVGNTYGGNVMSKRNAVIALDRVQLYMASGNITSGRMSVWGIAHA